MNAAADAMFDPVCFIDNSATDTQAWVFWNPSARTVCVAFRGTEQTKWKVGGWVRLGSASAAASSCQW